MAPRGSVLVAAGLLVCWCSFSAAQSNDSSPVGFIRVSGQKFVDDNCAEFLFSGWNAWTLTEYATNKQTPPGYSSGRDFVRSLFQKARSLDLNVLRFFVSGDAPGTMLLNSPTSLVGDAAVGLDFIFDEAAKAGIRLTPVLLNFWKETGVPQMEKWCGSDSSNYKPNPAIDVRTETYLNASERLQTPYTWYTSPQCKQQVSEYFSTLVNRKNSLNGRIFKDDPVVMSWNLLNEPRCKYCGPAAVDSWIGEVAAALKAAGVKQLVTTGEEGFFDEHDALASANPDDGNHWGGRSGQDFRANHLHKDIDYAVMHLWPDNWRNPPLDTSFGSAWIAAHSQAAQDLNKPLVMEEFGKSAGEGNITSVRDPWFQLVNGAVEDALASGGPLRGSLFWQWDYVANAPRTSPSANVRLQDTTFTNHIEPFSHRMAQASQQQHKSGAALVDGCVPVGSSGTVQLFGPGEGGVPTPASAAGRKLLRGD